MISVTREPFGIARDQALMPRYAIGGERHDDGGFIHVQTVAGRNGDDAALVPEAMGACQAIDGTGRVVRLRLWFGLRLRLRLRLWFGLRLRLWFGLRLRRLRLWFGLRLWQGALVCDGLDGFCVEDAVIDRHVADLTAQDISERVIAGLAGPAEGADLGVFGAVHPGQAGFGAVDGFAIDDELSGSVPEGDGDMVFLTGIDAVVS